MTTIEEKIKELTPDLQNEVLTFIDSIKKAKKINNPNNNGKRPFGLCKGEIIISDDFTRPLDDQLLKEWNII